jgi:hypothetical protein
VARLRPVGVGKLAGSAAGRDRPDGHRGDLDRDPAAGCEPAADSLQAGLNENSSAGPFGGQYWAFWSDTARGFLPQPIFPVSPGDWISASLTQGATGWTVSIADRNTGSSSSFIDSTEGSSPFATGEWLQEDPSHNAPHWQWAYQPTAPITFDQLAVNGRPPQPNELAPSVMALSGSQLSPGALTGDAFTIAERQPSA